MKSALNPRSYARIATLSITTLFVFPILLRGGEITNPVLIDDKSPIVYAPSATGWFGGVEATFFKMSRADGMRYDDDEEGSVDTDYSFTPRYTLGYRTSEDTGIRARFWGNFDDTSFPYDPSANPGDRVYGEASTFELEFFRKFSLPKYQFELSAGLQHADYFEAIFNSNPPRPESSKSVSGWGPVVGIEFRRDLRPGFQFYGKARHSLLATNASLTETSGTAFLNESNGGITEIGLGLEHTRVIGNAEVTLRGGYEWQQWHNFSYGFEDSDSTDDIGGPADAGFHGFVFGVGITGKGPDSLVGKETSSFGVGDFGLAENGASGLFGGVEATFFQYNRADGLRSHQLESVDMPSNFTPRYTIGYEGADGAGIRVRYWGDYEQTGSPFDPVARANGDALYAEASTVDVEFFDTFALRDYDLELSIGVQSANFFEGMVNDGSTGFHESKSVTGWGPVVGATLTRELGRSTSAFVKARHSLLMTNSETVDNGTGFAFQDGANGGITEIGFGVEHTREIGNAAVTLHGGYEWQRWHNFAFTYEDTNADDDTSGPGDAGFNGFLVGVNVTGIAPSDDPYVVGGKGAKFAQSNPEFFVGAEATFMKFGRADGMRFEDDPDDSVIPNYEFAPRYTIGYRSGSGLGIRARFWGDFDQRHLPQDPVALAARTDFVDAQASYLDVEVFDTFSLGEVELELSAGLQYMDYFEAIYDAGAGQGPESTKSVSGWGPVIGAEVKRPFFGGTHVTAKARHSLLLTDATITDDPVPAELNGSNAGITELGFGIEKAFSVRNSDVTVKGGYEWQRWHNASFGFEDSVSSDDVSGPADAGFRGFTIGVEITK